MGQKLVSVADVSVSTVAAQISTAVVYSPSVLIQASPANTVTIYVSDSNVSTSRGIAVTAGSSITIEASEYGGHSDDIDLSKIYAVATAGSQVAKVVYLGRL